MSNRTVRINELAQRELSDILHKKWQSESVAITLTEVTVSADLHYARVFVSVIGDEAMVEQKMKWLCAHAPEIRTEFSRRVVLKFLPKFDYVTDASVARGARLLKVLDAVGPAVTTPEPATPAAPIPEA